MGGMFRSSLSAPPSCTGTRIAVAAGGVIACLLLAPGAVEAQEGQPSIRMVSRVFVHLALIGVRPDGTEDLAKGQVEVSPEQPGAAVFPVDFGTLAGDHVTEVRVQLAGSSSGGTINLSITTSVTASMPRQEPARIDREREAQVSPGGTFLHQVYESPDHESSIVLTLSPESREVPVFVRPTAGAPILFRVVMSRITEKGLVDLENNILRTLGETPVSYSFKTAPGRGSAAPATEPGEGDRQRAQPEDETRRSANPPGGASSGAPGQAGATEGRGSAGDPPAGAAPTPPSEATPPGPVTASSPSGTPAEADEPGEEIELTLAPRKPSEGILVVEATLKRRLGNGGDAHAEISETVRKTGVVSRGGVMEILVGGLGEQNLGAYSFRILADF